MPALRHFTVGLQLRLLVGCLTIGVALTPSLARAQAGDSSVAEALFQEGRRLVAEQRFVEACAKFAESQRLEPAIGTLLNLAACHAAEGKTASAWSEFTRALAQAQRENRPDAAELAQSRIAELLPKLSKLVIKVAPENEIGGLEVRLDGQLLQKPAWGVPAPVDPGTYDLRASAPGYADFTTQITLRAGEAHEEPIPRLVPHAAAEPAVAVGAGLEVAPKPALAPPLPAPEARWSAQKSWAIGVAGAGLVGVGVSVALGLSAKSTFDSAGPHCDSLGCDPEGIEIRHDAVTRGRVATVVLGVGAAAIAAGGVLWLTAPRPSDNRRLTLGITPRTLVARWTWR